MYIKHRMAHTVLKYAMEYLPIQVIHSRLFSNEDATITFYPLTPGAKIIPCFYFIFNRTRLWLDVYIWWTFNSQPPNRCLHWRFISWYSYSNQWKWRLNGIFLQRCNWKFCRLVAIITYVSNGPHVQTLSYPQNYASVIPLVPEFSWNSVSGADSLRFYYCKWKPVLFLIL